MNLLRIAALLLVFTLNVRANDAFESANKAYASGDFSGAKKSCEAALRQDARANEFYNLGNASFRLGEHGRAVLAYERALALSPGHGEATSNSRFVRQKAGSRVLELSLAARMLSVVPSSVAPWLSIGLAWIGIFWGGVALWRRSGSGGVVGGALLLMLGAGYGAGAMWWQREQAKLAIVVTERVESHSEPASSAKLAEALPAGSRVRVISSLGEWSYCDLPSGTRGWLPTQSIETIAPFVRP